MPAPDIPLIDLQAQYRSIKEEINRAIQRVLDHGQFILGPEVEALEHEFATYCGTRHAVAVASGTDALELSLRAFGIGPGDDVITTALSFFATGSSIAALGATPVFVDIDPVTSTIDPRKVEEAITPRTKAIVPVHLYGHPCEMQALVSITQRARLILVEDCAQATGASDGQTRVGAFGHVGAFSFYPTKNLGAYGDGGMVVTNDALVAQQIRLLRMHGSRDRIRHEVVSRNSRLDEIQAAILRVKLKYLDRWNQARRAHARVYQQALSRQRLPGVVLPQERSGAYHVYHLYIVRVQQRAAVQKLLATQGVSTQIHYELPLHLEPAFAKLGYRPGACPEAEQAVQEVLTLPLYPELSVQSVEWVALALGNAVNTTSQVRVE